MMCDFDPLLVLQLSTTLLLASVNCLITLTVFLSIFYPFSPPTSLLIIIPSEILPGPLWILLNLESPMNVLLLVSFLSLSFLFILFHYQQKKLSELG